MQPDNRRIARNTIYLYLRMLVSVVISLYTSRVVLEVLGVDDYGVYAVVGGIVVMLNFLQNSMAAATSRFLTFEMGQGDEDKLQRTFSSAFVVQCIIALIVVAMAESLGLWFLNAKLNIPAESMAAANWVYQFTILGAVIGITQTPYNSAIIAREQMGFLATMDIITSVMKLLIVYLLIVLPGNKLILYGALMTVVSGVLALIYRYFCISRFPEALISFKVDKEIVKPMLSFSGYELYSSGGNLASQQGNNFVINIFFGVALNAASGIATTVSGVLKGFSYNIITAFRPQIIIQYAQNDISAMQTLLERAIKYTLLLFAIMEIPLMFEMDYVLGLWLVNVPEGAGMFCKILLIGMMFNLVAVIMGIAVHASGRIKMSSIIAGSLQLATVPLTYIIFRFGGVSQWAYIIMAIAQLGVCLGNMGVACYNIPQLSMGKIALVMLNTFVAIALATIPIYVYAAQIGESFMRLLTITIGYVLILGICAYYLLFDYGEKKRILNYLHKIM